MPKLTAKRLTPDLIAALPVGKMLSDDAAPGLAVRRLPSGARSYIFVYRMRGERKQTTLTIARVEEIDLAEARRLAKVMAGQVAAGVDPGEARREARTERKEVITLQHGIDHYTFVWPELNARSGSYIAGNRRVLMRIPEKDRRRPLAAIEPDDVKRWMKVELVRGQKAWAAKVEAAQKAGKALRENEQPGLADSNRVLVALGKLYTIAIEEKAPKDKAWATPDPTRGIKPTKHDERDRVYTADELRRILQACDAYEATPGAAPEAANAIRLLVYTGARLQEVVKARWAMFNLEEEIARWAKPAGHVKQRRKHLLDLDPTGEAMAILTAMRARRGDAIYLFPGDEDLVERRARAAGKDFTPGERPRSDLKRPWAFVRKHAGLRVGDTIHDIRRTSITWMFGETSDIKTVGAAAGHSNPTTTLRYQRLAAGQQRAVLGATGARISALREPKTASAGA